MINTTIAGPLSLVTMTGSHTMTEVEQTKALSGRYPQTESDVNIARLLIEVDLQDFAHCIDVSYTYVLRDLGGR
jgi:hypothetical protein